MPVTIDQCEWDHPGRDIYTGTPRAAIMAMGTIPDSVKQVLISRAERNDYDDIVFIDKDSVRGKYAYQPEVKFMAFGGRGTICKSVSRNSWSATHVESAMAFCDKGYCVARPSVCNNWSIIERVQPRPPAETFEIRSADTDKRSLPPEREAIELATLPMPSVPDVPQESWGAPGESYYSINTYTYMASPPVIINYPCPVTPVPEPSTFMLLAIGLTALIYSLKGKLK